MPEALQSSFNNYIKVGNIRNPWDWYVSLWAYGCSNKGGFKSRVKRDSTHWRPWQKTYSDAESKDNFNRWLNFVLVSKRKEIIEYRGMAKTDYCGLLTIRYLNLFSKNFSTQTNTFSAHKDLIEYDKKENFMDIMLSNENLNLELEQLFEKFELNQGEQKQARTNTSKRRPYKYYYNRKSQELVKRMDELIVNKYKYSF